MEEKIKWSNTMYGQGLDIKDGALQLNQNFLTLKQASEWATKHIGKNISISNISYLNTIRKNKKI